MKSRYGVIPTTGSGNGARYGSGANLSPSRVQPCQRHFDNPVQQHDGDWHPSPENLQAVHEGRALVWTGEAMAKWEEVVAAAGTSEVLAYGLARKELPEVVVDIAIPNQTASSGYVRVDPEQSGQARKEARRKGMVIKVPVHSHGRGSIFSSGTDYGQMRELAVEGCGYRLARTERVLLQAEEQPVLSGGLRCDASQDGATRSVRYAINPSMVVRVSVPAEQADSLSALTVEFENSADELSSVFGTSNTSRQHLLPVLVTCQCPSCGGMSERFMPAREVVLHLVGPTEIPDEVAAAIRAEVKDKVKPFSWSSSEYYDSYSYGYDSYSDYGDDLADDYGHGTRHTPVGDGRRLLPVRRSSGYRPAEDARFATIRIGGRHLCRVPLEMLEAAALTIEPLRQALEHFGNGEHGTGRHP